MVKRRMCQSRDSALILMCYSWNGEQVLMPLRGQPLRALEIGCFEGAATTWLLDNVLVDAEW